MDPATTGSLANTVVFFVFSAAVVFATVGVLYLLWQGLRWLVGSLIDREEQPHIGRRPDLIGVGVPSVLLALFETWITKMRTPGWWAMGILCTQVSSGCNLWVVFLLPPVLDALLIFVVLWIAYSKWLDARDGGDQVG